MKRVIISLVTLALSSGCAGLSARVDRSALNAVPNEELLVLFDAENGVYIARDEADLAGRTLQDAKVALVRARNYRDVIAARRTSGATIDSVAVLDLLAAWNDERIAMREAEVAWRETELATSDTRLWAARARYEREKARLVKDKNPSAGKDIEIARFDEQVVAWGQRETQAEAEIAAKNTIVVEKRARYFDLSRRLQEQSAGAYGGPWADLLD